MQGEKSCVNIRKVSHRPGKSSSLTPASKARKKQSLPSFQGYPGYASEGSENANARSLHTIESECAQPRYNVPRRQFGQLKAKGRLDATGQPGRPEIFEREILAAVKTVSSKRVVLEHSWARLGSIGSPAQFPG
jgi:hypothetical protein